MGIYKLAAFDMDGTLLDSHKNIRKDSIAAMQQAADLGKHLCLSTGRNPAELEQYRSVLPMVRYWICTSGALVLDVKTGEKLYEKAFDYVTVLKMLSAEHTGHCVIQVLGTESNLLRRDLSYLEECGMSKLRPMFEKIGVMHDDFLNDFRNDPIPVYKINYYCADKETRDSVIESLKGLDITVCSGERFSVECSPSGISKAVGLEELCRVTGTDVTETIAVGDSGNDLDILQAAGLGIAMGNSSDEIKEIAGAVVADCDSSGIAQAVLNYLI